MRVTIIGSAASYAGPDRACSSYLVQGGGANVLFDCGNGSLSNLQKVIDPLTLDAVFITHLHPDHLVDLFALNSMIRYDPQGPSKPISLYLPDDLLQRMAYLLSDRGAHELDAAFNKRLIGDRVPLRFHDMVVTPSLVEHTYPTYALKAEADATTFVYSSDTSPGPWVADAFRGADFILCEATMAEQYEGLAPHLTATQAGIAARDAGAQGLALTHIWATNDIEQTRREGSEAFGKPVHIARELDVYEI